MGNKYDTFDEQPIKYEYPITWQKRNKKYLEKVEDRKLKDLEEFPLEQDEQFCPGEVGPVNPEIEKENFLIINCGNSTDTTV